MTRHRWRVLEALAALLLAGILLRTIRFAWIARLAGCTLPGNGQDASGRPTSDRTAKAVGQAVNRAAIRLPWKSTCLVRALAGRLMLTRRSIPSTIVLGVAKGHDAVHAHAWLVARGGTVCGGHDAPGFSPIAAFGPGLAGPDTWAER